MLRNLEPQPRYRDGSSGDSGCRRRFGHVEVPNNKNKILINK